MRKFNGWILITAMATGCASPKESAPADTKPRTATVAPAPPPTPPPDPAPTRAPVPTPTTPSLVNYSLCSTGLPVEGMWKCDPILADINNDGFVDWVSIPRLGNGPHVFLGNGHGVWTDSSKGLSPAKGWQSCGGGMRVGDVNEDGKLDLLVADHCHGLFVYLGDGAGNWNMVAEGIFPDELVPDEGKRDLYRGAECIAVADFNADKHLDIVIGSSDEGGINIYYGDGTGEKNAWRRMPSKFGLPATGWANRVQTADMNGDGLMDVVASHSEGPRVWLNKGEDKWEEMNKELPHPSVRGLYTGIAVGDLNNDKRLDFATANWIDGPEAYLQQADGSWKKTPDIYPDMLGGSVGLALGDLDRDGNLDIVVSGRMDSDGAGYVRGVYALRGDGTGRWQYMADCGLPSTGLSNTPGVGIGDINGDSIQDVLACSGLIVETAPGLTKPIIAERLIVWCARLTGAVHEKTPPSATPPKPNATPPPNSEKGVKKPGNGT